MTSKFFILIFALLATGMFILSMSSASIPPFEYYKVIETNSLFRPLGWQPKPTKLPYALIGIIGMEGEWKALILGENQRSYYVSKGDFIEKARVLDVSEDHLTLLYEGRKYELRFDQQIDVDAGTERQKADSSPRKKPEAIVAIQDKKDKEQGSLAEKIEANREELNRRVDRWLTTGKVTRQMFYDFLSRRGISPSEIFQDSALRQQVQDEFHMEMMEMEDRGEM